jgi:hypothetical protein
VLKHNRGFNGVSSRTVVLSHYWLVFFFGCQVRWSRGASRWLDLLHLRGSTWIQHIACAPSTSTSTRHHVPISCRAKSIFCAKMFRSQLVHLSKSGLIRVPQAFARFRPVDRSSHLNDLEPKLPQCPPCTLESLFSNIKWLLLSSGETTLRITISLPWIAFIYVWLCIYI